jgi:hypothetical protein
MVKLEMTKMMGRYSQQQGLFGRESARLYFTAEAWGFLCLQCSGFLSLDELQLSKRFRVHRMIESGLVVKAARIQKTCTILRFATKRELKGLCGILGESIIAGQRCRLPKSAHPKSLWINDIINAVCGCNVRESGFVLRSEYDGIDLEFDGLCELYVTMRYSRYTYTNRTSKEECDPLLYSLICRCNPYNTFQDGDENAEQQQQEVSLADDCADELLIVHESEFEDPDGGRVYRVSGINSTNVIAVCVYPRHNNPLLGSEKLFDIVLAKELIRQRLTG